MLHAMYVSFFGMARAPFTIAPDPRALYMSERHREAVAHLLYGLNAGGGFVLLTGDIGAGKTTVCRCVLEQVPPHCNVAYIFNPKLTVEELLQSICAEFGLEAPATPLQSINDGIQRLNTFLLQAHAAGRNSVLFIDEAQNLSADVLEQLRLLTNLETHERKLLQIILIGQPELRDKLAQPALEQLAQRVVARFHLEALPEAETGRYIAHRLAVAGLAGPGPFDRAVIGKIHRLSRGIPRRINLLCDRALLGAYAQNQFKVDGRTLAQAAAEVFDDKRWPHLRLTAKHAGFWGIALGLLAGATLVTLATAASWLPPFGGHRQTASVPTPVVMAASAAPVKQIASLLPSGAGHLRLDVTSTIATTSDTDTPAAALKNADWQLTEQNAWQALAPLWKLEAAVVDVCSAKRPQQQINCFRGVVSWPLVRSLNRPGILTLYPNGQAPTFAVLVGLEENRAVLQDRQGRQTHVPLSQLLLNWRGEFGTYWHTPPGYNGILEAGSEGPAVDWVASQLARLAHQAPTAGPHRMAGALHAELQEFKRTHHIPLSARIGPLTIMQLSNPVEHAEPQLTGLVAPS